MYDFEAPKPPRRDFNEIDVFNRFHSIINKRCEGVCGGKELLWENTGRETPDHWEAHHKDGDPSNNSPDNLLILCWGCHEKTLNKFPPLPSK